jgi:hypothetical protein
MTVPPAAPPGLPDGGTPDASSREDGRGRGLLGRRGFVATVLAGTAVSAAAVGRVLPGGDAVAAASVPTPGMIVLAGSGIDPSGGRGSTAALQSLIDASPEGASLWLPAGLYLVDGLVLRTGQSLTGPPARSYLGSAAGGARLQARLSGQTAPVLVVGAFGHVADISVAGHGRNQAALQPAGIGAVLERVTMLEGSVGFDAAYVSGTVLSECMVHENGVGIANLVDSMVQTCVINANSGDGISLGAGANDNMIVGNKIEWNDGHGIQAYQALHNVVIGGIVDRNGKTGARLVECSHTTVVGSVFRRNGRLAADSATDDCHIYQENCTGLVVTGVTTNHGPDDDGSGRPSPAVAIRDEGGTDVSVIGNDLTGRTSAVAIATGGAGSRGRRLLNGGVAGAETASGMRVRIDATELDLPAGRSGSAVFELGTPAGETTSYRLHLVSRDGGTGARGLGEAVLLVSRDSGDAEVAMSSVDDRIGDGFGAADRRYRVQPSVTADGAQLTIAVHNAGAAAARIGLELT